MPKESPFISLVIAFFLVYLLRNKSLEIILLNIFIYFLSIAYIHKLKKLEENLIQTRTLYDWNRLHAYELENAKKDLENHTKVIEYVSQMEERNRISREIHDTIGHKLTGTLMQLEASLSILNRDYDRGKDMLHSVRDNLRSCTELMRQTVKNIKPKEYTSRIILIRQMLDEFSRETGVSINFNITGSTPCIYPSIEMLLYKNIQEAVTNSVRHGKASCIDIELTYLSNHIILTVEDNGTFKKDFVKGMGISGMEERAKLLGGKVVISTENRFTVKTVVPISVNMKTN
jgi:signal transduction histidine kinase